MMSRGLSRDPSDHVLPALSVRTVLVACRSSSGARAIAIAKRLSSCCGGEKYGGRRWRPNESAAAL